MNIGNAVSKVFILIVGGLFVFSGLIKLNDPVGTAIKFEEYFDVFSVDFAGFFHYFVPFALPLAVIFCVAEVIAGLSLLIGYKRKSTILFLLALILFFTFLTFYSAYFNKVTDCGCFGDAIPLDPWESFFKDIILLAMITFLLVRIKSFGNNASTTQHIFIGGATLLSTIIAFIAIQHLPYIDFRSYKKGADIGKLMQPSEPCEYIYVMEKDGKTFELKNYPTEAGYEFKEMLVLNEEACKPKITDYNISNDDGDFTDESLTGKKFLIIIHDTQKADIESFTKINDLISSLEAKGYEPMALTSDANNFDAFRHHVQLAVPYYLADATVLKTMVRSNPGLIILNNGVVEGKWHFNDVPTADDF